MEFHNMQISNYQYLTKVFQKKLGTTENSSKFGIESMKTNILLWGLFMSSAMNYTENLEVHKFGSIQEHELRGNSDFIRYHSEVDIGAL